MVFVRPYFHRQPSSTWNVEIAPHQPEVCGGTSPGAAGRLASNVCTTSLRGELDFGGGTMQLATRERLLNGAFTFWIVNYRYPLSEFKSMRMW